MQNLHETDKKISEIIGEIDFYSLLTPLNQQEERKKFFDSIQKGEVYNPQFNYKNRYLKEVRKILQRERLLLNENNNMQSLFVKKLDFILKQLELLESGDVHFGDIAASLHGRPDKESLETARQILLESKKEKYVFPEESVSPEKMASILAAEMTGKDINWKVVLSRKIVPKITISGKEKAIYINANIHYTSQEVERLKIHEIKVHIYRGANGAFQPFRIFAEGLAGYNETEEGLAILGEEKSGCLKTDTRQMKLYAARALSVDYCMKGPFYETFMNLKEFFPDYLAYRLTERGKRGLKDTSQKGGLTKGFHYISGWRKIGKYVEDGGDLRILYVGKIGLEDVGVIKELLEQGELKYPKYLPEFINSKL